MKSISKSNEAVIGIDLGTGSVKCTLLNGQGRRISSSQRSYPTSYPKAGYAEQDPSDWYSAVVDTVREALSKCEPDTRIAGIGICGAAHIPVLLDDNLDVLRPAILWTDLRSVEQVELLNRNYAQSILRKTYNRPSCTWTLPQLMWLSKHEPDILKRLYRIVFGKDYIIYKLTGQLITDEGNAAGTMMMDMESGKWSQPLFELAGLNARALPPIHRPQDVIGTLNDDSAKLLGLPSGIPVIAGALDSVMELWSLGLVHEGETMVRMGTAGGVMVVSKTPKPSPYTITYPYLDGQWCTQAFNNSCASALQWMADILGARSYEALDQMVRHVNPGSEGLIFHPFLLGERAPYWDADLRASFVGATMLHKSEHFIRSVMEGVAYSLRDCRDLLQESGYQIGRLKLTGGGSKSALWSQILSDVLGTEMVRADSEGSVLGIAMLTGTATGIFSDSKEAVNCCVVEHGTVTPQIELFDNCYSNLYTHYKMIVQALQPIYHRMAKEAGV